MLKVVMDFDAKSITEETRVAYEQVAFLVNGLEADYIWYYDSFHAPVSCCLDTQRPS